MLKLNNVKKNEFLVSFLNQNFIGNYVLLIKRSINNNFPHF